MSKDVILFGLASRITYNLYNFSSLRGLDDYFKRVARGPNFSLGDFSVQIRLLVIKLVLFGPKKAILEI